MGADFVFAVCEMPDNLDKCREIIDYRIKNLNDSMIASLAEDSYFDIDGMLCDLAEDMDIAESDLWCLDDVDDLMLRKLIERLLKNAVDELTGYRRDVGRMVLGNTSYAISGGMSWGDSPTDCIPIIRILDMSGVMKGLGAMNIDYESFKC